jgi:hypothetical protein
MKNARFPTDRRLWFYLSVILLVAIWCVPWESYKNKWISPLGSLWSRATPPFDMSVTLPDLLHALDLREFISFAVAAVGLGWLIQRVVVMVRTKNRKKEDHVA